MSKRQRLGGNPSAWGDLLTNYDGTNISYDEIGNPTNWVGISSLSWSGRTLTSQTLTNGNSITYKYNSDGIRTQKRVYDDVASAYITHDYVLDGTKIIQETVTDNAYYNSYTLYYIYDAAGSITGLHYNNQPYYFQKNIQGDILCILDRTGTAVVEYTYDAWGNILSVTGSMASTLGKYNPFRYRGYYYDNETDLYYLNSRYYDAEVGRFINADGIVGANGGLQGYNMFAYCNNNPVNYTDSNGYVAKNVITRDDGFGNSGATKQGITDAGSIKTQKAITYQGIVFIYYPNEYEFSIDKYDYYKVKLTMPDDTYVFLYLTSEKLYVKELPYNIDFVSTAATNSYNLLWDSQVMINVVYNHHNFSSNTDQNFNNRNGGWYGGAVDAVTSKIQTMFRLGKVPGMMCRHWDPEAAWDLLNREKPYL